MSHTAASNDSLQWVFFGIAGLFVLYQMGCGWRRGMMREACRILALVCSYAAGWFGGPMVAPSLRRIGFPDLVLSALAGFGLGVVTFLAISLQAAILFKKTSQQKVGLIRFGYGLIGSLLAMVFGLIFVWVSLLGIRVLGSFAQGEIAARRVAIEQNKNVKDPPPETGMAISNMADLKDSLDHGVAGPLIESVDPLPPRVYTIINKMTAITSNIESAKRFLAYPGAHQLATDPRVTVLCDDPAVARQVKAKDLMGLMKNPRLVEALNDPGLVAMLKKFEFEKALDYALDTTQKGTSATNHN
jgi:uncharacterized membrane protein required for colicin V production